MCIDRDVQNQDASTYLKMTCLVAERARTSLMTESPHGSASCFLEPRRPVATTVQLSTRAPDTIRTEMEQLCSIGCNFPSREQNILRKDGCWPGLLCFLSSSARFSSPIGLRHFKHSLDSCIQKSRKALPSSLASSRLALLACL